MPLLQTRTLSHQELKWFAISPWLVYNLDGPGPQTLVYQLAFFLLQGMQALCGEHPSLLSGKADIVKEVIGNNYW